MTVTQLIKVWRHGQDKLLKFKQSIRMERKGDLSDLEMVKWLLVPHELGWVFQKLTAIFTDN